MVTMNRFVVCVCVVSLCVGLLAGAASGGPMSQPSAQDANYLQTSISGDRFEILGGKIALQGTQNAAVRALAHRLIHDHTQSLREAVAEARKDQIKVPTAPTPSMVWELNVVRSMGGSTFDRNYSSLEVKDHQQDIEETTFEAQHGSDPEIKQDARKELPMLRMHLALSEKALRSA
jgi:putative membrane protein